MIVELSCLAGGVPLGYLLRHSPHAAKLTDDALTWSVRVLLFLLGLSLGLDDFIMANLGGIGLRGIFITLCGLAGTLLGARLIDPLVNRSPAPDQDEATPARKGDE